MAKRFGRNQRRRMREEYESLQRGMEALEREAARRLSTANAYQARAYQAEREMKDLRARCIEVDAKVFDVPRDMLVEFQMMVRRYDDPRLFSWGQRIDKRVSEIEADRARFIQRIAMFGAETLAEAMRLEADEIAMLRRLFPEERDRRAFYDVAYRTGLMS